MNKRFASKKVIIRGMHCASCEVLIADEWKNCGVEKTIIDRPAGAAEIFYTREPSVKDLDARIAMHGYRVEPWTPEKRARVAAPTAKEYAEVGGFALVVVAAYVLLRSVNLIPEGLAVAEGMGYGLVFAIGLAAAFSTCMAVTGSMLLAVSAKQSETLRDASRWERFKPHLFFNAGRIIGYAGFGAGVGALGAAITASPKVSGVVMITVSAFMVIVGLQLLKIFPALERWRVGLPKLFGSAALAAGGRAGGAVRTKMAALGAATFFLPCGFTQALQLYVLANGGVLAGALTMGVFALGTLPGLLSIGAISSVARGAWQQKFVRFAGVLVVLMGLWNIQNGFALAGYNVRLAALFGAVTGGADTRATLANGVQVAEMKVVGLEYEPAQFSVRQGVPVEWRIDGSAASGCARVVAVPELDIVEYLPKNGIKIIRFTPQKSGFIGFSCTMGMTTPGAGFTVLPAANVAAPQRADAQKEETAATDCDPAVQQCVAPQHISMEISRERGFYPETFTVKKGLPVEFTIDTRVPLRGCMSTLVIPDYGIAHPLKLGRTTLRFTPTKAGEVALTCAMGNYIGSIYVTD